LTTAGQLTALNTSTASAPSTPVCMNDGVVLTS
jgi:hypothetical protein